MIIYIAAFVLSLVFGIYWTPVMAKAATQMGIVDRPDGQLKEHASEVPYLGGLAVFTSFLLTVGVLSQFEQETLGLLLSATIILLVGLIDDFGVKATYDAEVDVLRLIFRDAPVAETDEDKPGVILDYDRDGNVVVMEILDASKRVEDPRKVEFAETA